MASGTSTPLEAGQGPSVLGIAASIGAKIRDAAEDAKEQREKAAEKGETPKKGSLFKSALGNQFNPIKSKKAKSKWAQQFDWNKKTNSDQQVKPPSTGGGGDSKGKLKEFIAGGFTAILQDTAGMVSRLDGVKALTGENLAEVTRASSTLTVIKESIDAQTELRRKALEEAKFARAEKQLEKTTDNAGVSDSKDPEKKDGDGEGDGGGGGFNWLDGLLGGLDGIESIMQIKNLLAPAGEAAAAEGGSGLLAAAAPAAAVLGTGAALGAGGEGMFQLGQWGDQKLKERRKLIDEKKARGENTFLDEALQIGQTGLGEVGKTLGVAMDVGGAPISQGVRGAMALMGNQEEAYNMAKFDTRVREHARGWMNRIDFMNIIPDQKGGFGNIYGNDAATKEMAGKMSEGGMVPNAVPLARGGVVDNPTRTMLNPGDAVIPLNRNSGKDILGNKKQTSPEDTALDTVGAMILGVSAGMLGKTDSGTVGDQVKQDIRKASKEFGISNLTFTSSIGQGQFGKVDPNKSAKSFMESLFKGISINSNGKKKEGGGGNTSPTGGNIADSAVASLGQDSNSKDLQEEMNAQDLKLEKLGLGGAIVGTGAIKGDEMSMPWCAAFVATKLSAAGYEPPNAAWADAYRSDAKSTLSGTGPWGTKIEPREASKNDVILFDYSGKKKQADHVAIVTGNDGNTITYVGGNQGGGGGKVTEGKIGVNDKTILMVSRATKLLPGAAQPTQVAQAPQAQPTTQQPTVQRVAESGMMSPSLGSITPMGSYIGYANGGTNHRTKEESMRAWAETLRRRRATEQRTRLGVQKVNGKWVNMGVSDKAVTKPWWQTFTDYWGMTDENTDKQRKAKQEALAKSLAQRLNKQEANLKPSRPSPARGPSSGSSSRPAPSQSSSTAAVISAPPAAASPSSAAAGSFGSEITDGKTKAMVFADFLYVDLV